MPTVPKHNPARNNARVGVVTLPETGRVGPAPSWPIPTTMPTNEEWALWVELWKSPQAVQWERMGIGTTIVVARYCGLLFRCQNPKSSSVIHGQAAQLEEKLGLTPKSMRMLLWEIAAEPDPEPAASIPAVSIRRIKAKDN